MSNELQTVDIPGIEIFSEGVWNSDKYDDNDLQSMIDAFGLVGFEPTVKAGHADGQDNLKDKEYRQIFGAPALGYVSRIYRSGKKLLADLKQVPKQFASLIKSGTYKRVSSEIYWSYKDEASGKTYPRVLKSIAFLGAEIPALTNLKAIEALFHKNDAGLVYAYEKGREYRVYAIDKAGEMTVAEKDGKWCVYKDGVKISEHKSKDEAIAATAGGDKRDPKEIPVPFYKDNYSKGEMQMTEAEVQAKIDAELAKVKTELTKSYEAQTEAKVAAAVAAAKADAEADKTKQAERIALLEKQNEESAKFARNATIDARLGKLKNGGKVTPVEEVTLRAIFRALPEMVAHSYSDDKGAEVKEPVAETVWKLFESRNTNIFRELAEQGTEIRAYSGKAQDEVVRRANALIEKDDKLDAIKAYSRISKEDPELWRAYQLEVRGSH